MALTILLNTSSNPIFLIFATLMAVGAVIYYIFACGAIFYTILKGIWWVIKLIFFPVTQYFEKKEKKKLEELNRSRIEIANKYPRAYKKFCSDKDLREWKLTKEDITLILSIPADEWLENEKFLIKKEKQEKEEQELANSIKVKYADGYKEWKERRGIEYISNKTIIASESIIKRTDSLVKQANKFEKWEEEQSAFTSNCLKLAKQLLPDFGRYYYYINFEKTDKIGICKKGTYKIWNLFVNSTCLENDLDYSHFPNIKTNTENIIQFQNQTRWFKSSVYESIAKYLEAIVDNYCKNDKSFITVLLNTNKNGWSEDALNFHLRKINDAISQDYSDKIVVSYPDSFFIDSWDEEGHSVLLLDKIVVVLDMFTTNLELKELSEKIVKFDSENTPLISYISILKAYDRSEMIELIKEENEKEQKRIASQKIEENSKRSLLLSAKKWATLSGNLHYTYLFDYYPTTCQFEATEEEWANRRIVWNFKNDKTKISTEQHKKALGHVVPEICRKLEETFNKDTLKYLSLVCIPASTNEKNRDRYELFSQMLCEKTGMTNCFSKVTVIKDKTERRSGGSSIITENLSFDQSFFNNRYVLLFDDIITRGDSMRIMKLKLESLGATVVAGISIGKTKHERDAKQQGNVAQNTDRLIERRRFTENEISAVTNAVVTSSSDKRLTVAVFLKQGQPTYFPLYEGSNVGVGEYVNMTQAYLRTSIKNGQRILEIEYNRPEYDLPF